MIVDLGLLCLSRLLVHFHLIQSVNSLRLDVGLFLPVQFEPIICDVFLLVLLLYVLLHNTLHLQFAPVFVVVLFGQP